MNILSVLILTTTSSILISTTLPVEEKKIVGHWTHEKDLYDMRLNDTLIFNRTDYTEKLYHWGGALSGIEMNSEHDFAEYHNVLCSTESSPIRYSGEKWLLENDRIRIKGDHREIEWKILNTNKKRLTVLVTKLKLNEQ